MLFYGKYFMEEWVSCGAAVARPLLWLLAKTDLGLVLAFPLASCNNLRQNASLSGAWLSHL